MNHPMARSGCGLHVAATSQWSLTSADAGYVKAENRMVLMNLRTFLAPNNGALLPARLPATSQVRTVLLEGFCSQARRSSQQHWGQPSPMPFSPPPPALAGPREDTVGRGGRPEWYLVSGQQVVSFTAREKGSESLFLRLRGYEQLLVPEVPPGCHVERHVG